MSKPKTCDQCQPLFINGHFCHEIGCPNDRLHWDGEQWIGLVICLECRDDVPKGEVCRNCYGEDF